MIQLRLRLTLALAATWLTACEPVDTGAPVLAQVHSTVQDEHSYGVTPCSAGSGVYALDRSGAVAEVALGEGTQTVRNYVAQMLRSSSASPRMIRPASSASVTPCIHRPKLLQTSGPGVDPRVAKGSP